MDFLFITPLLKFSFIKKILYLHTKIVNIFIEILPNIRQYFPYYLYEIALYPIILNTLPKYVIKFNFIPANQESFPLALSSTRTGGPSPRSLSG
jgi:hypothetical protein